MKTFLPYLSCLLLLSACANQRGDTDSKPGPIHPAPKTVRVNTEAGYGTNLTTGDSILPLLNSLGDTLLSGVAVPIAAWEIAPDSVRKPVRRIAKEPALHINPLKVTTVPNTISVIPIPQDSLKRVRVGDADYDFLCLSSAGDTIPTGVAIATEGKRVATKHPQAIKALSPSFSDNAINNMQYLDVSHGLAGSYVPSMLQDKKGNMWFATFGGGLSKYNGETFTNYTEKEGLANNRVYAILEDRAGSIWACTYGGGLSVFNGVYFTQFTEEEGLCSNFTRSIMEDSSGNIWIGTDGGGVSMYNGQSFTNYSTNEGLSNNSVRTIIEDSHGAIWIGTTGGGACKLDRKGVVDIENESFTHYTTGNGLAGMFLNLIVEDRKGNLWFVCNGGGVSKLTRTGSEETFTNYTVAEGLCGPHVYSFLEDKDENIWIGTYSDGLSKLVMDGSDGFMGQSITNYSKEEGLSSDEIYSIVQDRSGNIWFCTWGSGVSVYKGGSFSHLTTRDGLPHIRVYDIQQDDSGNYWLSTDGGGLSMLALQGTGGKSARSFKHYAFEQGFLSNSPTAIFKDRSGDLWTSSTSGASKLEHSRSSKKEITNYTDADGLSDHDVREIIQDDLGNYWFATGGGLSVLVTADLNEAGEGRFVHYTEKEGLSSNLLSSILQDKNGDIWIGTDHGLSKLVLGSTNGSSSDSITHYTDKEGLIDNDVRTVLEDKYGDIWIGTRAGLSIFTQQEEGTGSFVQYTEKEGLSNDLITSLVEDSKGNVWVGTDLGLNEFVRSADGATDPKDGSKKITEIKTYGKQDGLIGVDFIEKSAHLDDMDRIWWGTGKGLSMLDMNDLSNAEYPPVVTLTRLDINEQFIDYHNYKQAENEDFSFSTVLPFNDHPENLCLNHDNDHLTFYFSAMDWSAPQKIKYSYLLEGANSTWSKASKETKADYRNIPSGDHTFKVRAIGQSNEWSEAFEYHFKVLPPWYRTWWMYLLYGLTAVGSVAFISRWRSRELRRKNEHLEREVGERTTEIQHKNELLSHQTEQLMQLDEAKTQLYTNITHEFRTPLTVIQGMTNTLNSNIKDKEFKDAERSLDLIRRNGKKLLLLVNELLDLAKLESGNMQLHLIQADIIPFVKYLSESFHSLAEQKQVKLTVYSEIEVLEMDFDVKKLTSVIANLLSNAIKFTQAHGKIIVHLNKGVEADKESFILKVQDNGQGLSEEDLPNIFNKFFQVNNSSTRSGEGTGIGLSLTKELVEIMNGRISARSTLGKGSTFIVEIPITHRTVKASDPQLTQGPLLSTPPDLIEQPLAPFSEEEELPIALLIEDNEDVAYYIEQCLKGQYLTLHTTNGVLGLETAYERIPDIIVSDVMMPEMDGFEVCRTLKQDERTSHIPIILLTAKATSEDKLAGLSQGADAYLIKPFEKKELLIRMSKLLEIRQTLQKKYSNSLINTEALNAPEFPMEDGFVEKFRKIIEQHLEEDDFSLQQLASELYLSRSQVHRKIKALTGMSTAIYVRQIRLRRAKVLLSTTELSISEIAYQTGFKTPVYFSQVFKETYGQAPSATRK